VGRQRARWLDEVKKDARKIGIRRWWTMLLQEAETLNEFQS
jgi:hypothetical protein